MAWLMTLDVELSTFIKKIISAGGIDLQIDGLGENGHIGFNEPDTSLKLNANVAPLSKSTIQANSRFFENLAGRSQLMPDLRNG